MNINGAFHFYLIGIGSILGQISIHILGNGKCHLGSNLSLGLLAGRSNSGTVSRGLNGQLMATGRYSDITANKGAVLLEVIPDIAANLNSIVINLLFQVLNGVVAGNINTKVALKIGYNFVNNLAYFFLGGAFAQNHANRLGSLANDFSYQILTNKCLAFNNLFALVVSVFIGIKVHGFHIKTGVVFGDTLAVNVLIVIQNGLAYSSTNQVLGLNSINAGAAGTTTATTAAGAATATVNNKFQTGNYGSNLSTGGIFLGQEFAVIAFDQAILNTVQNSLLSVSGYVSHVLKAGGVIYSFGGIILMVFLKVFDVTVHNGTHLLAGNVTGRVKGAVAVAFYNAVIIGPGNSTGIIGILGNVIKLGYAVVYLCLVQTAQRSNKHSTGHVFIRSKSVCRNTVKITLVCYQIHLIVKPVALANILKVLHVSSHNIACHREQQTGNYQKT